MADKQEFTLPSGIGISAHKAYLSSLTNSSSVDTGALITPGGAGFGQSVSLGGFLHLFNGNNFTALRSAAVSNAIYTLPSNYPSTGSSVLQSDSSGLMSWVPMVASSGTAGSGFATTSSYSYQSGYATTSGLATTANYAYQSGYATTSGLATTANYAYQSGYAITSGFATTASNVNVVNATSNSAHSLVFTSTATGSGVALSTNTTLSYNPSTNILSTSGLAITSTTASTSASTGALTVAGGVGIAGSSYFGNDVTVGNSQTGRLNFSQGTLGSAGTTTNPSLMFVGQDNNPITLSVLSDNTLSFEGSSGQLFSINNNLSSGTIFSVNDISGIPIIRANANGTLSMGEFTGTVGVGLTNPSYKLHIAGDTNLSSGYVFRINGNSVLSATSLGTGVTNSSLTAIGTITTGVWSATAITAFYGGTGYNSYTKGDILVGAGSTFIKLNVGTDNFVLTASSSSSTGLTWSPTAATGLTTLNGLNAGVQFLAFGYSGTVPAFSSSGSTHTLNIPIASSGSTGLISTQAQTIAGQKTFTSAIIGDLSGTATTANYALQSGYAITSGLASTATLALTVSSTSTSANADYNIPFLSGTALSTNNNLYYNPSTGRFNAVVYTGSWAGNAITSFYGGTGYSTYATGELLVGAGSTLSKLPVGTNNFILVADSSVAGGIKWANVSGFAITNINGLTSSKQDLAFGYSGSLPAFSSSGNTHTLNIPLAGTGSTGLVSTQAQSFAGIKTFTNAVSITDNTGSGSYTSGALTVSGGVGIGGTLNVQGDLNVQGTFTTINSTTITVADKNIELGFVATPTDITAQGGGITLRGATDKSINWYSGVGWSSSESWNLAAGNTYKINGDSVISSTSLGTGVTNSSLTALGVITTGTWSGSLITAFYGGTGYNSYTKGDILVGAGNTFIKLNVGSDNFVLTASSTSATGLTWAQTAATGITTLNSLTANQQFFATGSSGSGFNISSSGSTHTFNIPIAGTGATGLVSTLAQSFAGVKTFTNDVIISSSTASTFMRNGALQVYGGVGISGQLSFNQAAMGFTGILTNPSLAFIGTTGSPITLSVLADNSLSFEGSSGQLFSIDNNLTTGEIFAVSDISGLPIISAYANQNVTIGEFGGNLGIGLSNPFYKLHVVGSVGFTSNIASTSTSTGTLVVTGGVGIGGSLNVNSASSISAVRLDSGIIYGNLVGTATTAGFASTSNYSHQAGYAITSGIATTATYAIQAGYAVTSGSSSTANTATYANQSGYGLTSGFATTANYANQSGYAITSGSSNTSGYATTAGLATTATYSIQSGYAITSGSATTATYAHQSGYGLTSGFATTATYSYQSGYGLTSGFATTANYANQSGYAITSGSSGLATTATYAHQSGYAITSGSSGLATTATYSHQSGYATTSGNSNTSGYATTAGFATTANYSNQSGYGITAGLATTSTYAHQSGYATTSGSSGLASTATYAHQSGYAITSGSSNTSGLATTATYAHQSGYAITSGSSNTSGYATTSGFASTASYSYQSGYGLTSGLATTANYAHQSGYAITSGSSAFATTSGLATTANYAHQAGYAITSGSSTTSGLATTATYANQSGYAITSGIANSSYSSFVNTASANLSHPILFSPITGSSSGAGLSLNTILNYNPSSNILFTSGLAITATTISSSTSTGALTVAGGVGISGRLSFNQASFGTTGISSNPTIAMIGSTGDPIYLSVLEDNTISFEGSQGQLFSITPNLSTGYIYSVNDITGIPLLRANANANVTANEYAGNFGIGLFNPGYKLHVIGSVGFTSNISSTSTTSGTLVVAGGVGIGGSLNANLPSNISSVILNNGNIYGNLIGTATTAGFASTANYSNQSGYATTAGIANTAIYANQSGYGLTSGFATTANYSNQSGYAITSGSSNTSGYATTSGLATTSTYSHQSGYAITSGSSAFATTATYAHQSGYGLTSGFATTANYAHQSGYAITSGTAALATTSTYSHQSGYAITSGSSNTSGYATTSGLATTANYSHQSGYAITSGSSATATTATYAHQSGYATTSGSSGFATTATYSYQSGYGLTSGLATTATYAHQSGYAITSGSSNTSGYATTSGLATTATYAHQSGYAITSGSSNTSGYATTSGFASTASYAYQSGYGLTSGLATTANYAHQSGYAITSGSSNTSGYATTSGLATTATYAHQSGYGLTSGFATTSSYAYQSGYGLTAGLATSSSSSFINTGTANTSHSLIFAPITSSSSGSGLSLNSTLNFNPSTNILYTSGLAVTASTVSSSSTTGALTVAGGLGVGSTSYFNTDLNVGNSTRGRLYFSQATLGSAGTTVIPSMAFIGATNSPITLSVLPDNSLSFDGSSGQLFSINNNLSTGWIFSINDISGLPIFRTNADLTVAMGEYGGNTGIGLSNPSYKLHVAGDTNLSSGYVYRINGTSVLSSTSLGTGVTNSSLTALGTITTGTWAGTTITSFYGGTGYQTYSTGDLLVGTGSTLTKLAVGANNFVLVADNTVAGGVKWSSVSGIAITNINGLTASKQDLAFGYSGSVPAFASSGNTHILNIPLAGSGSTGLVSTQAQTFAGQKTFTSAIIGDLTGTATTAGFASTASYAHQAGYGITSGFATTASYSHQAGFAITSGSSGTASTATYAHQAGYAITSSNSGLATTASNLNVVAATTSANHPILFTPTFGSASGVAVSTESSFVYNPSTDILSVSGISITSSTASTSTSTGALIVSGGVGIGGSVNVGGRVAIGTSDLGTSLSVSSYSTSAKSFIIRKLSSQTSNLLEIQDAMGQALISASYTAGSGETGNGVINIHANRTISSADNDYVLSIKNSNTHMAGFSRAGQLHFFANIYGTDGSGNYENIFSNTYGNRLNIHKALWHYGNSIYFPTSNLSIYAASTNRQYFSGAGSTTSINWAVEAGNWNLNTRAFGIVSPSGGDRTYFGGYGNLVVNITGYNSSAGWDETNLISANIDNYNPYTGFLAKFSVSNVNRFTVGPYGNTTVSLGGTTVSTGLIIKAATSQTGNLFEAQSSAGATIAYISSSGSIYSTGVINNSNSSTTALSVKDGSNNTKFNVDTIGGIVSVSSSTASTSTSSGALLVSGGVGIGGSLYVASATAISGVTINAGVITGNLTGTATSAGFATTSSYSHQSGYGVTSGFATTSNYSHTSGYGITAGSSTTSGYATTSGLATTATYAHQAGYAITSGSSTTSGYATTAGFATTANYAHQSGYAITSGSSAFATTASYSYQSGYGLTSGLATTANYSHQSGYAITSGNSNTSGYATTAGLATTATYSHQSGYAITSGSSNTSGYATTSGLATTATYAHQSGYATTAGYSNSSGYATTAGLATTATYAYQSGYAITSGNSNTSGYAITSGLATTSTYAYQSGYGLTSGFATTANYAYQSGYAITSGNSNTSGYAITSGLATTATYSYQSGYAITSGFATTASYSYQSGYAITSGLATTANYSYQSGYGLTSGFATTSSYSYQSGYAITSGLATSSTSVFINNATANSSHPLVFTPTLGSSSGAALSTNSTVSYNPSANYLYTSGLAVTASTASTSTSTGALIVNGGVGISGQLSYNTALIGTTGIASQPTMTFIGANGDPVRLRVLDDSTLAFSGSQGQLFSINPVLNTGYIFSVNDISGVPLLRANADATVSMGEFAGNIGIGLSNPAYKLHVTGSVGFTSSASSTSPTTGALVVTGGVGIGGTLFSSSSYANSLSGVVLNNGVVTSGSWAGSLITGLYGGTGFNSYTKGDLLVGSGTTLIKHAVGTQNQILIADVYSGSGLSWATFANPTYGSFYSTSSQQVVGAGATTLVNFNSTYESNRVSIIGGTGTSSRIQIQDAGPFSITFSAQINLTTGTQPKVGDFWFRVNGVDVPQSNTQMTISGKDFQTVITVNFVYTFANNDYFEIAFSSSDTEYRIEALTGLTNPTRPDVPSIICSVLPVTHIVGASGAGISGILSINGSTSSQQYFVEGHSGTNFNIQTGGGTHTFNIPYASTGATGLVTTLDQSFAGVKTFTNDTIISSSTASTSFSTGALLVTGGVGIGGALNVQGDLNVQGTFTTINSTTITVADKNIELGVVTSPTDITAQGGGITLRGATDKSINWYSGVGWSSSESWNLANGNSYKISGVTVLSASSLGTGVTNSSLTALGTITTGVWAGTSITALYGGTGLVPSFTVGDILYANTSTTWGRLTASSNSGYVLTSAGAGTTPVYVAPSTLSVGSATTATYSHQSGYAITSGSSGFATTASYAYQSGYGLTSGLATTANYAHQSGYAITSGNSNTSNFATNANYAYQSGYGLTSGLATTANYAYQSGYAITSGNSNTSGYAITSGLATTSNYSYQSGYGLTSGLATTANYAYQSGYGLTSGFSTTASYSYQSGYAITSGSSALATTANYAHQSGYAITSGNSNTSGYAVTSGFATTASNLNVSNASTGIFYPILSNTASSASGVGASVNSFFSFNAANGAFGATSVNIIAGQSYSVGGNSVLSASSLGTGVTNSSLTALGTITTGTWSGSTITSFYGGSGYQTYATGDLLIGAGTTLIKLAVGSNNFVLTADNTVAGGVKWTATAATGLTTLNGLNAGMQYFATGTSGSGFNISSSGSTHTFNIPIAGTGATGLVSTLAQSFAGVKTFTNDVIISSSTASTFIGNGALQVYGGVGISGRLSFNQAAMGFTGILTNPSIAFIGTTGSPITLSVLSDNSLSFEGSSGQLFSIDNNLTTGEIFAVSDISGLPIISAYANQNVSIGEFGGNLGIGLSNPFYKLHVIGSVGFTSNIASTSTSTGTLVVTGGVGIGGSLNVNSASSISGVRIDTGIVYGNLTGTATTAGFASTANYSNQSGYGITSGFATTSSYSYTSGYGITAGLASTATYSHQSGYAITSGSSGFATTATYAYQSGYGLTSGLATTATYSHQSGYAITSGSSSTSGYATTSGFATTASYAYQSGYGLTSGLATTATYAHQSGYAITSGSSNTSGYAITSGFADTSTYSYQSGYGLTSGFASTATYSYTSGYGITSGLATTATYAHQSGFAQTATSASTATTATNSTYSILTADTTNATRRLVFTANGTGSTSLYNTSTVFTNPSTSSVGASVFTGFGSVNIRPGVDSTSGVSIGNSSGSSYVYFDTINGRIGINQPTPLYDLHIVGEISATNKSFVIDHPTKPDMMLRHGSLEGPENGVYVRGKLVNNNIIELPDYWLGLVDEDSITVSLTPVGKDSKPYLEKIENYKVYVNVETGIVNCHFVVYGERKDIPKLDVEY